MLIGRKHSDEFEWGLCEFEAQTSEDLETHLSLCEKYFCRKCDHSETRLKEFKEHMQNTHAPREYDQLTHLTDVIRTKLASQIISGKMFKKSVHSVILL